MNPTIISQTTTLRSHLTVHSKGGGSSSISQITSWQLETIAREGVDAVNVRNFDESTSPWTSYSPSFENVTGRSSGPPATWASPSLPITPRDKRSTYIQPQEPEPGSLSAFLNFEQGLADANPDYHIEILDVECTFANEQASYAAVIMTAQIHGLPSGVVRPILGTWDFAYAKDEKRWMATRLTTVHGVGTPA